MRTRILGFTVSAMLIGLCVTAWAQPQPRVPKIGWLGAGPGDAPGRTGGFVRRELIELGYNVTGFANLSGILGGKRLELFKETVHDFPALWELGSENFLLTMC
jgi:hypothetical protein